MEENKISNVKDVYRKDQASFSEFFSLSKWEKIVEIIKSYLHKYEGIFKLIGFNVAIAGLFLNLKSDDIYLKRIEVFFILFICILLTWFIIKSLLDLFRGRHSELYYAVVLIPGYVGGTLIFNIWKYLFNNFSSELLFYFHIVGIPMVAILVNVLLIIFLRFISKIKKIKGNQMENFFLITLNFHLGMSYMFNNYDFHKTIIKLSSFEFTNLFILYLFFVTLLSELRPFTSKSKREALIETIIFVFILILPFLIKYVSFNFIF